MARYSDSSAPKPARVLADIKRGTFQPVYVLVGADSAAADELLRALKEALVQPGMEAFDYESVRADEQDVQVLLQHIRQPAVASKRRLVVVRGIDVLAKGRPRQEKPDKGQARKDSLTELLSGLAGLPDACAVALTCDFNPTLQKAITGAGLGRFTVDLRQPDRAELAALIQRRAKELGVSLAPAAVRLLIDVAGEDTTLLSGEVEKLATAVDAGETISEEDVRNLAGQSRQFELNEYVNAVMNERPSAALGVLERLRDWGEEPVKIVAYLAGAFLNRAGYADYREQKDEQLVRRCLLQLYEIDRDIKSGHPESFALLEAFTVCAACTGSESYCPVRTDERPPEFCMRRERKRKARRAANTE
jgi:DNA polymerase-3 subunit delta